MVCIRCWPEPALGLTTRMAMTTALHTTTGTGTGTITGTGMTTTTTTTTGTTTTAGMGMGMRTRTTTRTTNTGTPGTLRRRPCTPSRHLDTRTVHRQALPRAAD